MAIIPYSSDGRRFAPRVQVWSLSERYLYRVHAERAWVLCFYGMAEPYETGRRIWRVNLTYSCASAAAKAFKFRAGTKYSFLDVIGYTDKRLATYSLVFLDKMFDQIPRPWEECMRKYPQL